MNDSHDSHDSRHLPALACTKQVYHELGISKATFYELIRLGKFPKPIKLGGRNAWPWAVVREWLDRQNEAVPA